MRYLKTGYPPSFQTPYAALTKTPVEKYFEQHSDKAFELYNRTKHNFQDDAFYPEYFTKIVKSKLNESS